MTRIQNEFRKVNSADNGDRFVYTEESITAGVYLKMFMPSSEDSVFYIEYTIEDAVVIHNDVAELYWNVLGSGYTEDIEDFQVLIHLPGDDSDLRVWSHGPLTGENKIIDTRTVSFTDYDVDSYTAETIRLMFAKSLVPSGTKVSNVDGRDYILQYEQQMADEANAYREQARIELINEASQTVLDLEENQTMYYYNRALEAVNSLPDDVTEKADFLARIEALKDVVNEDWIKDLDADIKWFREYPSNYDLEMIKEQIEEGFDEEKKQEYYAMMPELEDILYRHNVKDLIQSTIILFIPLVIILAFGIRALIHNRKDRNAFGQKYFRDFPSEDTPGAIEYLTLNKVTTNSVAATILDLIRRKIIKAEEIPGKKKNSKDTELTLIDTNYHGTPEENLLIKLLFTIVGKDHKCTLKELQDYGTRSEAKARRIRSTINTFTENSKEEIEKKKESVEIQGVHIKAAIEEKENTLSSVTKQLEEHKEMNEEISDFRKFETKLHQMKKEIQKQNQNLEQLNQHISVNEQSIRFMDKKMEEYKETEMNYTLLKDLSDTANGEQKGKTKISFERFVQSVYFDLILAAANERLSVMSEQRYYLLRKEENDINKGSSGLELEILDEWTGKRRNVRSLSGGESFKAALSLALGLSDVIQNKKGGIQVDTIFIDEGFGTLDADSLNKAMQIINSLSLEGNKLVGIISHVDELKDQIDQKIEVYKDHAGSKVK